jgi:hypothetical protein
LELRALGRNIFLDGNTFANSPHLEKRTMVRTMQLGATLTYYDIRLSYSYIFVSKEFAGPKM